MLFKSVQVGGVFLIGSKMYVKYADFPKLAFGKAKELLNEKKSAPVIIPYNIEVDALVINPEYHHD